jgi:8-oxo-dGTP diphosphatase
LIQVAAAIIENEQGQVLIARKKPGKPQAGLWEFPGGKLESGESPIDCLKRELREEMQITIEPSSIKSTLKQAYDNHADLRNAAELEGGRPRSGTMC